MQFSWMNKIFLTLAVLVVVAGVLQHFVHSDSGKPVEKPPPRVKSDYQHHYSSQAVPGAARETRTESPGAAGLSKLPREKVEVWLNWHSRDAMSLLAAYRALRDTNYLNEAAKKFPDNPQVELAVLMPCANPAERRQ